MSTQAKDPGFARLVWSDYRAHHSDRAERLLRAVLLWPPRLFFNPSLQLALLVRIAQRSPGFLRLPIRWVQVVFFSSEIYWFQGNDERIRIGPGINFPHPMNIIIGPGSKIGSNVTIYNNFSMGTDQAGPPEEVWKRAARIEDGAVIFPYCSVQGPRTVGREAVVAKWVEIDEDVPAGALKTSSRLLLKDEWDRSRIWPTISEAPELAASQRIRE